jgi:hypothetical protein
MSNYDNTNRGAMWRNTRKQSDTHPDLSGSINIDGKEYWISGWTKKEGAADSAPVVSMSVRPKEDQGGYAPAPAPAQAKAEFDDIPW